ncbi:unnamed protein product, partial [Laminaria digitata]
GGGALLPDSASSPWSDRSVDLNVVDYVLRKPFSDESFRLLLEAAEADHLQVPMLLKGMNSDTQNVGDSEGARVKADKDLASALMEEEGEEEESEAEAGESGTTVLATEFDGGCKSSDHTGSEFEHSERSPTAKWDEQWLPYRERPAEEDAEEEKAPAAVPWLPEPALLPPPPQPRPPRDLSAVKPPVPYRPQLYSFPQSAPPLPLPEKTGSRAALPTGPMIYPPPALGIPMQMASWSLSSAPLYPNLAMTTAVVGP